ncbi:MAG: hypothetical protein C4289_15635 [Chloroflexota bacterium]
MPVGAEVRQYEFVEGWPVLPEGWTLGQAAGVAVDTQDRVYVFHRGPHPVIVFDREGHYLAHWGDDFLKDAHGLYITRENGQDVIYLVDRARHVVEKCTADGRVVLRIGTPGQPGAPGQPFNRPTDVAVAPNGDIYVSDGYGNVRVHQFAADGRLIRSWGEPGTGPGQFNLPHSVWVDTRGPAPLVYVADRENHRIQVFDANGKFITMWNNIHRPDGIALDREGHLYIGELNGIEGVDDAPGLGHRVSVYSLQGQLQTRLGDPEEGEGPTQFIAPHGVAVDSEGSLYVGDVAYTIRGRRMNPPRYLKCLRKFRRVRI